MTKLEIKDSKNYAPQVIRVPAPFALPNADRLVGLGIQGFTVITQKDGDIHEGDLAVFFPAEAQLSEKLAAGANLFRHNDLNDDQTQKGYLEDNRRVRALKLRGTVSNGLLLPVAEVERIFKVSGLAEGDIFDHINGAEVSRKYRLKEPAPRNAREKATMKKAFKRVDEKLFPVHIETDQYLRNEQMLSDDDVLIVSQKLHGTSIRLGNIPVRRRLKWHERALKKLGVRIVEQEHDLIAGSRQVTKDPRSLTQNHFYKTDIWTRKLLEVQDRIPVGFIIYGELVGWTPDGAPIQKGHTYRVAKGESELFVYRVAMISDAGDLYDLSWDQVRMFCGEHGFQHVAELWRGFKKDFDPAAFSEKDFFRTFTKTPGLAYSDQPVPLSPDSTGADEGVAIRVERGGRVPLLFKIKNDSHYLYETAQLDAGEVDMESAEAIAA